jgi:hypothetical protein
MVSSTGVTSFALSLNRLNNYHRFPIKKQVHCCFLHIIFPSLVSCDPVFLLALLLFYADNGMVGSADRDVLDEVEIRQLLIDHIGHRCCWGSHPARTWKITSIEDCNVYVGTLETFIEERHIITKKEPNESGNIDGREKGPLLGLWELDLRSKFPALFVPEEEVMVKIPHSDIIEKCSGTMCILFSVPSDFPLMRELDLCHYVNYGYDI